MERLITVLRRVNVLCLLSLIETEAFRRWSVRIFGTLLSCIHVRSSCICLDRHGAMCMSIKMEPLPEAFIKPSSGRNCELSLLLSCWKSFTVSTNLFFVVLYCCFAASTHFISQSLLSPFAHSMCKSTITSMAIFSKITILTVLLTIFKSSQAGYTLKDDYSAEEFFSMFDFFTVC